MSHCEYDERGRLLCDECDAAAGCYPERFPAEPDLEYTCPPQWVREDAKLCYRCGRELAYVMGATWCEECDAPNQDNY